MNRKAHTVVCVNVFNEILKKEYCPEVIKGTNENILIDVIKRINTVKVEFEGTDLNLKRELRKLNYKRYGFRERADFDYEVQRDVLEDITILKLIPNKTYKLEDDLNLEKTKSRKLNLYKRLLGDTYERLKTKSENIIDVCDNTNDIKLFAQKIKQQYILLAGAFFILLISWFGVNYLPTANESVHTYFNN